jgi:chromosome segregation ATPase
MAQHEQMLVRSGADTSPRENSESSEKVTAQVAMALSALDSRYKENIADYAQELHSCTHKIEMARIDLEMLQKQKVPHDDTLLLVEKELEYALRLLERLTEQWIRKTAVVSELETELEKLGHSEESDSVLQSRRTELESLQMEIEDLELTLLNHELEKQNLLLKIEPIERKIDLLTQKIRELESQKHYIESAHLHRITQVAPVKSSKLSLAIKSIAGTETP